MKNEIGERVKQLRQEKKLTQQHMAEILKIDQSNYSKYELGKLEMNNEMLIKIAKFFGVTTDYILGLEN